MKRVVSAKGRDPNPMLLTVCFILGVANFYMHKAVAESGHRFVEETKRYFSGKFGPYGSYAIELALLIGALWLGEPVTTGLVVALVLVAAGIVLVNRKPG